MMTEAPARESLGVCRDVSVSYGRGDAVVRALDGVDFEILQRESLALLGRSGSGKTTLLSRSRSMSQAASGIRRSCSSSSASPARPIICRPSSRAERVSVSHSRGRSHSDRSCLLCDEPTGHLDSDTAERVLDLIEALQEELQFALVIATHDADVAARLDRAVELHDGKVVREA